MEQQIGITAHGHCQQCTREIILFRAQSFCAVLNAVTNTREQELPQFCRNPRRNKQLLAVCLQQRHQMLHQRREMLIEQRAGVDQEGVARGESFQVLLRSAPAVLLLSRQVAQQRFRVSRREQSICRAYAAFIQQHRHFLFVKPHGAGGLPGRDHCGIHHIGSSFRYFLSIIRSQAFRLISGRLDFLFSCAPLLTHRRLPRLFQGRLRKFANLCFSGAFFASKTWGSRKRMSKKIRRFCLVRTKQLAFLHRSMVYYAYEL